MRTLSSWSVRRGAMLCVAVLFGGALACAEDDISGPIEQIGPPLLDMEIAPAASAPLAGNRVDLSDTDDTLTVSFTNLPAVPAGTSYQVFLVDSAASGANAIAATGELIVTSTHTRPVNRDSSVIEVTEDTTAATDQIAPESSVNSMTFTITDASIGASVAAYTHVVVAVTTAPTSGAFTLDPAAQRGFLSRSIGSGSLSIGTWSITSALRRPYSIQGTGIAAFVGDDIRATFERILRPPEGFQYVAWLIDERTGIHQRLGGLLTPVPEGRSLADADLETGSFLTDVAIVGAQLRAPVDVADNYTRFVIVLEPKGATGLTRAPRTEVMQGAVPSSVGSRHPGAGKIFGKVVSGTGQEGNATVYLTGQGLTVPLLVGVSDPNGDFRFRTVQIGAYTVNAIPAGDSIVRASTDVTISVPADAAAGDSVYVTLTVP